MAKLKYKWWGVEAHLSHKEACQITDPSFHSVAAGCANFFGGQWGAIVSVIVLAHVRHIRNMNQKSGKKGVKLKITYAGPTYIGCERRGKGKSPC